MNENYMKLFFLIAFGFFLIYRYPSSKKMILWAIKETGIIWDLYPEKYVVPSRKIRKQYDLKKTEILKFWNMQLYWINIEGILWWSGIVIFLLNKLRLDLGFYIFCFLMYISAINCCVIILKVYVYKKHKKKHIRMKK